MPEQRDKQKRHGAQSDQGGEGQKLRTGEPQERAYEGAEEHSQQRRAKERPQFPYEGKEGQAEPGYKDSA